MRLIFCIISVLFSLNSVSGDSWSQSIQSSIDAWRQENHVPGMSVMVSTPKRQDFFFVGSSQKEKNAPVTSKTKFGVGSITKTFIGALLLKLEEESKLKLDDPLGAYFSKYPRWSSFTLRQLVQMTVDIPNFYAHSSYIEDVKTNPQSNWTPDALLDLAYQMSQTSEPVQWVYSNTNYLLLGKVIEKATGMSLREAMDLYFIKPMGLENTIYSETEFTQNEKENMAHGYYNDVDMFEMKPSNYGAAGSMFMSIEDLEKWVQHLFVTQDVLSSGQLQKMLDGVEIPSSNLRANHTFFGLGVFVTQDPKFGKIIWYTGAIQGHSSVFVWVPKAQIMVLAQVNHWEGSNFRLLFPHKPLMQMLLGAAMEVK